MSSSRKIAVACLLQGCAIGLPLLVGYAGVAHAEDASPCLANYRTSLDARLSAKADESVDELRRFVYITRAIHQLDVREAVGRVEAHRAVVKACERAEAEAEAAKAAEDVYGE